MTVRSDLYGQSFVHEAWLSVDESGTEAAAGIGASFASQSAHLPWEFDHPFLFLIRDTVTGAVLFMGRVMDPSAG